MPRKSGLSRRQQTLSSLFPERARHAHPALNVELIFAGCLRQIDKLEPTDRIPMLNRLLRTYGVRREEVLL